MDWKLVSLVALVRVRVFVTERVSKASHVPATKGHQRKLQQWRWTWRVTGIDPMGTGEGELVSEQDRGDEGERGGCGVLTPGTFIA